MMPDMGNAQLLGAEEWQNDYFGSCEIQGAFLAVVADGIGKREDDMKAAALTVKMIIQQFKKAEALGESIAEDFFQEAFESARRQICKHSLGNRFGVKALAVIIRKGMLYYDGIGDCGLFLCRRNRLRILSPIHENLREKKGSECLKILPGDMLLLCSRGAYQSLTETEMLQKLGQKRETGEKCQELAACIRQKGYNHQENATLVLLENMVWKYRR